MRRVCACILVLTLSASGALAQAAAPLPAGGAAGVPLARNTISPLWVVTGGLTLLGLGALLISSQRSTTGSITFGSSDNNSVIPVNNTAVTTSSTSSTN